MSSLKQNEGKIRAIERKAIEEEDIRTLSKIWFNFELTDGQAEIVDNIAYGRHKRISVNAYTRYGKTQSVAIGICMYIMLNNNKRIAIIAPQKEQTDVLREYISECIIKSPKLQQIVQLTQKRDILSLKKEASQKKQTFTNGCEYRVFSAFREAYRLMGFGGNLIIKDEAALISRPASAKIGRMLGDDPEGAILVELTNPWDRDTLAYDHYTNPDWKTIHIDYKQGIHEGRTTQKYIDEQRAEITPIEFTVLYESNYPEDTEDTLIKWKWIKKAQSSKLKISKGKVIYGLDVAEKGIDITVLTRAETKDNKYIITNIWSWHKADTMETVELVNEKIKDEECEIHIDAIGVGKGVFDRLKQLGRNAIEVIVSMKATEQIERYPNQKSQFYMALTKAFEEERIKIPEKEKILALQLNSLKYQTSTGKVKIIDPKEKSPDFADSLMLVFAKPDKDWMFGELEL